MPSTALMSSLLISEVKFRLDWGQEQSGQASGAIRTADLRPALWKASISCGSMDPDDVEKVASIIDDLIAGDDTFYVWNPARQYPRNDSDGSILGAAAVTIGSLPGGNRTMSIAGLPAAYHLAAGDMLAVDFGSPTSRWLGRIVTTSFFANGSGVTGVFAVTPHIDADITVGAGVILARAAAEMRIVPGSFAPNQAGGQAGSLSFEAVQVID